MQIDFESFKQFTDDDFGALAEAIGTHRQEPRFAPFWASLTDAIERRAESSNAPTSDLTDAEVQELLRIAALMRERSFAGRPAYWADFWNDVAAAIDAELVDRGISTLQLERIVDGHEPETGEWTQQC